MGLYLLDSNVFIQAHRMYYPFDVVPGFWQKLKELGKVGKILSIDKVKKEICDTGNPDQLSNWMASQLEESFFNESASCVDVYAQIAAWANANTHYYPSAIAEFLETDLADPWLIAYAKKNDCVIVTNESSQPDIKRKIKIPEPCVHFGVRFISPIQMFRELGETF
ncbi:hypothetical protein SDC9_130801 [bioreactor metagenome]|uniref:Twitching motility protein PilT n=2 Tax=root TaxID=1 RepID=A0A0J7IYA8_9FLAO|nr:DUF4411 family protein [Chryseobacterium koreense]KMQ70821.1 hypothetical protein ACM44_09285 [Chryseobacterium koreense CCUG 49689]